MSSSDINFITHALWLIHSRFELTSNTAPHSLAGAPQKSPGKLTATLNRIDVI
jgi:hypothetical protein